MMCVMGVSRVDILSFLYVNVHVFEQPSASLPHHIIVMRNKKLGCIWPKPSTPSRLKEILDYNIILVHINHLHTALQHPIRISAPHPLGKSRMRDPDN